jgi:ABC-type sugar transport system substrate-binding protein
MARLVGYLLGLTILMVLGWTVGAPPQRGKPITVVMIPKIKGIDYFNACERGAREAAKELGNVKLVYEGPTEATVERQVELIEAWIPRKPDVIAVACNDPNAIAPALKKAMERGIHVLTWDADARRDAREFFINQATYDAIAQALVDEMAKQVGADAPVAVVTSSFTAPNQTEWLKRMKAYMAKRYPKDAFAHRQAERGKFGVGAEGDERHLARLSAGAGHLRHLVRRLPRCGGGGASRRQTGQSRRRRSVHAQKHARLCPRRDGQNRHPLEPR